MDLVTFVDNKKTELIQIYIRERTARNEYGILFIGKQDGQEAKVVYLTLQECPPPLREEVLNKIKENPSDSIIYFYLCTLEAAHIIEIDLNESNESNESN